MTFLLNIKNLQRFVIDFPRNIIRAIKNYFFRSIERAIFQRLVVD